MVIDSGCDQSIVNSRAFVIISRTGVYFNVDGPLMGRMKSSNAMEVVSAATLVTTQDGKKYILIVNQALCDTHPEQTEALLQPHQCRAHSVAIDDVSRLHQHVDGSPGGQCIQIDDTCIPLFYDGYKSYLATSKPSEADLDELPHLEITSPLPYEPQQRIFTRRRHTQVNEKQEVAKWRANLGYPTVEVVRKTLQCTTQLVPTVEAETREYMRDHFESRLRMLRPHRINDVCFSDTFFSSIPSVRGYSMFQMFAFQFSKYDVPYLMRKESQGPSRLQDLIRDVGAARAIVTDNAKMMTGTKWKSILRANCIEGHTSEAYHQNQNLAESRGGQLKTAIIKLFHNTPHAPLAFWCYALEYLSKVRSCLARESLDWRPSEEAMFGETLDISVFRFPWFSPVWYYDPRKSFPDDKMIAGYFLDIARNVGDAFSYVLISQDEFEKYKKHPRYKPQTLVRSVVRLRKEDSSSHAPRCSKTLEGFVFTDHHGNVLVGEDDLHDIVEPPSTLQSVDLNESPDSEEIEFSNDDVSVGGTLHPPIQSTALGSESPPVDTVFNTDLPDSEEEMESLNVQASTSSLHGIPTSPPSDIPTVTQDEDDVSVSSTVSDDIADDINNHFMPAMDEDEGDDDDFYNAIHSHRWLEGTLEFQVETKFGEIEWLPLDVVRNDDPYACAEYILASDLGKSKATQIQARWARKFLRNVRKTIRRLNKVLPDAPSPPPPPASIPARRAGSARIPDAKPKKKKKPGPNNRKKGTTKYGVTVPINFKHAVELDKAENNTLWQDAVKKEIAALIFHKCFEFKAPDYKPPADYQYAPLQIIFEVKNDLRRKMRLVILGNKVDPRGLSTRATVVKGISVRLLSLIAHRDGLTELCGDIGNAFIQAETQEKIYTRCGTEFGDKAGCIALIVRALYGLTTSAERFRTLLADYLRSIGFVPTRYDRDVWMRLRESNDGYDYICTHVDDFKIVARDPEHWMNKIKERFLVKSGGPPDYYLGNDFRWEDSEKLWTVGSLTYTKEAIRRIEEIVGELRSFKTPLPNSEDCHPEMDQSELLDEKGHRLFQMLLGMAQWLVTIGRPDICFATSSLSRFGAAPREYHLKLAKQIFGYLKKFPDKRIAMDSTDIDFSQISKDFEKLQADFKQDYPWAKEDLDPNFPKPFGRPLQTTILCDADHAHDLKSRRSITGIIGYVGSTPVLWRSTRQTSIASSTYAAEFMALRTATEEAISLRYMLRCLGVPVPNDGTCPTRLFGDNLSVIQNASNPEADLKKKHVALSFHFVREAIAAGITVTYWLKGKNNKSDIMTKQIESNAYKGHVEDLFWKPAHRR